MKKYLIALPLISALFATGLSQVQAQTATSTSTSTPTKQASKAHAQVKKAAKSKAHSKVKAKPKAKKTTKSKVHAKAKKNGGRNAQAVTQWNQKYKAQEQAKAKTAPAATPAKMPFSSAADDDDREPELSGTKSADFSCEMGNRLTIYKNDQDDKHIAIRWNQRISRLTRVTTTTGANRFENHKIGLVWIGIPAKGILLDSKKGQQLANECKNATQASAAAASPAAPNS